jgi:hypothetical protein
MKTLFLSIILVLALTAIATGASLSLTASWTPNTEPDMASYKLYRTDGTRALVGTILHPTSTYDFSVTVPDGSAGTLTFVLQAVDTNGNTSPDSLPASYVYNLDATPPTTPRNFDVRKK